jgi:hypothetical protein
MKKTIKKQFVFFLLLVGLGVFAQDNIADPGGDAGTTLPASPINNYIILMLLVVLVFGYKILIVKNTEIKNN